MMMFRSIILIGLVAALGLATNQSDATLHRFLSRRYAYLEDSTTTSNDQSSTSKAPALNESNENKDNPARLYPDLAIPPPGLVGNAPAPVPPPPPMSPFNSSPGFGGPTPFLPFAIPGLGAQNPNPGPLNLNYQPNFPKIDPKQQQQPASGSVFTSTTLGERLLRLANGGQSPGNSTENRQALQNATVLDSLNRGVHSVYDNLSKAYNSTIQRQIELLQERLSNATGNANNPWQQQWADQVSRFYKSMAARAGQAQQNLNAAWNRFKNANSSDLQSQQWPFGNNQALRSDSFLPDLSRPIDLQIPTSINQATANPDNPFGQTQPDMVMRMRDFWNSQVRPQIQVANNMIRRTWHDLTASGAQVNDVMYTSRNSNGNNMANSPSASSNGTNKDFVDNILDMVHLDGPEYSMIDQDHQTTNNESAADNRTKGFLDTVQNNMINMQRDINQLWKGLTNSLESTLNNVQRRMMPANKPGENVPATSASNPQSQSEPNAAENEISSQLKDINSLQQDADRVYDAVQRERYNQKLQQDQVTMTDRIKKFYNNLHIDENVNKIGTAVNDFWNHIPVHWNNMMNNMRPHNNTSSTAKPMV